MYISRVVSNVVFGGYLQKFVTVHGDHGLLNIFPNWKSLYYSVVYEKSARRCFLL